jgi:hypothetical protein
MCRVRSAFRAALIARRSGAAQKQRGEDMKATKMLLVLAVVASTGCYKYAVKVGRGGDVDRPPAKSEWSHHFIAGAVGEGDIDVSAVCPTPDATVKIERNVLDAVLGNVVGNVLWQPSTVEVYCGDGRAASLTLDEDNARRFAQSQAFHDAVAELEPDQLPAVVAYQSAQR